MSIVALTIARSSALSLDAGDERAVDLEHVEREALEAAERRVAGAEVVERERQPVLAGACRARSPASRPPPSARVSVISSASVPARSPRALGDRRDLGGERRVDDLAPGDVDRDAERRVDVALPGRGLAAGLLEDLQPELGDQAGLLGDRDELERARSGRARGAPSARAPRSRPAGRWRGRSPAGTRPRARRGRARGAARSRCAPRHGAVRIASSNSS